MPWRGLGWLYLIQFAQLLLPLVSVPFLARTLGPESWGRVAAAQGLAMLAGLFVEFGLNLSGARRIARHRDSPDQLRRTFSAILSAQCLLLALVVTGVLLIRPWIPFLASDLPLCGAALVWMMPQVIGLQWYFQGVERLPWLTGWLLLGRLAGLFGLVLAVRGPSDGALSLLIPGLCSLVALLVAACEPWLSLRPRMVWGDALAVLREEKVLCLYRAGVALQGTAHTCLLAFVLPPAAVGAYAGGERLAKAALGALEPLLLTVFNRMAFLVGNGHQRDARSMDRSSLWWISGAGLAIALVLSALAPAIVEIALGPAYPEAVDVLRILSLWPLANALCQLRCLNALAAQGRDGLLTIGATAAGGVQLLGFLILGWLGPESLLSWVAAWAVTGQFLQWLWLEYLVQSRARTVTANPIC